MATTKKKASKKKASKKKASKKKASKKKASKKEASKKKASKKKASKKKASKKEASKKEASKKEASKKEASKKEASKKKVLAQPTTATAMFVLGDEDPPGTVGFETHVWPLFRPQDVLCMISRGVPLANYDWFKKPNNFQSVYDALEAGWMPPDEEGKWEEPKLRVLAAWAEGGFAP